MKEKRTGESNGKREMRRNMREWSDHRKPSANRTVVGRVCPFLPSLSTAQAWLGKQEIKRGIEIDGERERETAGKKKKEREMDR